MNKKDSLEDVSCCLGCKKDDTFLFEGKDLLHHLPGVFKIVKCNTCGLMRTNPRPTPEAMGFFYPDDYGPYLDSQVKKSTQNSEGGIKKVLKKLKNTIFNFQSINIPDIPKGRMLEVGCASGAFLHKMAAENWEVRGIEFSEKAALAARQLGHQVQIGSLENASQPEDFYDLIVGWMVLEHLHYPVLGLKKLNEWAKPDAKLVLSVPNAASMDFHLFKDKWFALQLPTHTYHYTPESLRKVLFESGWEVEKIFHQRTLNNSIFSLGYVFRERGYPKLAKAIATLPKRFPYLTYVLFPISYILSLFGQTGRMTVWARKIKRN